MLVFVPVLRFHCRLEVILLVVVKVCAAAPAFPRSVHVQVEGWLWVGDGPSAAASR